MNNDLTQIVMHLEAQVQQDPEAILPLTGIYQYVRSLPRPKGNPLVYVRIQNSLGNAFFYLLTGDRASNLQRAILCYQEVLHFLTPEVSQLHYAVTQNKLGSAYAELLSGDRTANLQQAIACYQEVLQFWTPETAPRDYAMIQSNLGNVYAELPTGDRAANLQQSIACFREALRFLTREIAPLDYAAIQNNLGETYQHLPTGDQTANLQQAIACYQEVLQFWTPETAPLNYATAQNNLGNAYRAMPTGDPTANLQKAILCYQEALRFQTPETDPRNYAAAQNNLGVTYVDLPTGDQTANLQKAILCYQEALRFRTPESAPLDYAATQNNLGYAYTHLPTGDRVANLQQAIACSQEALRFWMPETAPLKYAKAQIILGVAYAELPVGDLSANLQQAIACYQEALRFQTPERFPHDYAATQVELGNAYADLPAGDHLQQAIACYQEALRFHTPEAAPFDYAATQASLGVAYTQLSTQSHLQKAIVCYQEALRFWTPEAAPFDYATTQTNLGVAYANLPTGDRVANLQKAIACYQEALRFRTPESSPLDYAATQNNLGHAYAELPTGDRVANQQKAIVCYRESLRFRTPEHTPNVCRRSNRNLANLYFTQKQWKAALEAYRAAMDAGEQLYRAGLSAESKVPEIPVNADLYRHAAFSALHSGETADALLILEQGKTRLLSEALRLNILRPANVPSEVWGAYMDAAATVRLVQAGNTTRSLKKQYSTQTYTDRIQFAHAATLALDRAITRVRIHVPDFLRTIDLRFIHALLPDDRTVFVLFCITEQGSMGLLVTNHDREVQVREVPDFTQSDLNRLFVEWDSDGRAIDGWLGAYARYRGDQTPTTFAQWQETMEQTLDALGQRLLDPILSALPTDIEHLIFLPSAELFLFPLHAVPLAGNDAERVGDRYQVSYAPSIEVLAHTRARAMQEVAPNLYAVINPEADPHLVFTPREGTEIAALFPHSTLDEGQAGTKQQVMTRVRAQTYLHFSCHGSYNWDDPSASGLNLADGRLTLTDLQEGNIDLSATRLVTLSACETGMIDVIQGSPEEYVGVPAGFMLAGVPCVVGSLWTVPDLSTALLMERFYHNHLKSGMGFPAALREAQRWVRTLEIGAVAQYAEQCYEQSGRKNAPLWHWQRHYRSLAEQNPDLCPFAHPYYWAAFTVNGW